VQGDGAIDLVRLDVPSSGDNETHGLEVVGLDDGARASLLENRSQWLQIDDLPGVCMAESHCFDLLWRNFPIGDRRNPEVLDGVPQIPTQQILSGFAVSTVTPMATPRQLPGCRPPRNF
jgi:hypothetical protein